MAINSPHSVHSLVRLLKSFTDPPSAPGPSKIEIACLAWSDPSFCAASKGEVIGEWILTLLGQAKKTRRERVVSPSFDPIADSRYWTLLCDVLTILPSTTARPIKTWLLPLLNRLQLDTIVVDLLIHQSSEVLAPARTALSVLWPLAEKKIGLDALAECLNAVFNACTDWGCVDDNLAWICAAVVSTYRNALANVGNKKKLYNSFLTSYLSSWLCTVCASPPPVDLASTKQLQDSIYATGAETLFSLDALKQPLETLFNALSSSSRLSIPALPKLLASFLSATHRHRSALFVPATSDVGGKEEVRKRGMEFVGMCWLLIRESASPQEHLEVEKWKSITGVLRIVEKERLFVAYPVRAVHTDVTKGGYEGELALSEARDKAVETLETIDLSAKNHVEEQKALSIQVLDVLVQIEYSFLGVVLERVLSALINFPPPPFHLVTTVSSKLLAHVLEYHSKTRTVHTYALTLLSAVAASSTSSASFTPQPVPRTFPLAYHFPTLARALRTSLIPTQVTPLATAVVDAVENAWRTFKGAKEEQERLTKKPKVTEDTLESDRVARLASIQPRVFSYMGRVAGTILSSLPASAYTKDGEHSLEHLWTDVGKLGWSIIWDCLKEKADKTYDAVKVKDSKKRRLATETSVLSEIYPCIVISVALRFLYDIRSRVSFFLGDCDRLTETQVRTLLNVAQDEASNPELVLEIIRSLLWHIWYTHNYESPRQIETHQIFVVTLDVLTARPLSKSRWSGISADLTRDNLGLAVLYVLAERWIDILDALASTENLERLITAFLVVSLDPSAENAQDENDLEHGRHTVVTAYDILLSLLRNAQFWELHNMRAVFLSSVLTLSAPLSSYCFLVPGIINVMNPSELTSACNVYNFLHYVPPEYFTRPARTELVKRAMAADVQICLTSEDARIKAREKDRDIGQKRKSRKEESDGRLSGKELRSRRLTSVRVFLHRMGQFIGTPSYSTSLAFVSHLLSPPTSFPPSRMLTSITIDLIQLHTSSLLCLQEPEAAASISSVIYMIVNARPFSQPKSRETWAQLVIRSSVLKLIERMTGDSDPASLPDQVRHALKTLLEVLESALSPDVERLIENDAREPDQSLLSEQITAWSRMLSLRRWLGIKSEVIEPPLGVTLATSTLRNANTAGLGPETCSSIFGLLFEELWCMPDVSHGAHLDVLVAFYAVNGGDRDSDIERTMDIHVTQTSKKMSVEDFSHLLDVLKEGIGGGGFRTGHRERLIHLGQVMLHDAPQGTLKIIRHFATGCINLFADQEEIYGGSSQLKLRCLEFISRHCSERPAAVRSIDLGSIWSLLNKILSGSSEHDTTTMFPIFHHIVTIIGALIRLRRDLVVHTFSHVSLVLRQLMMLTRKIRPQLGAKQSKIVSDTFPSWLSASQPLSTDEARALARLLVSFTTKTVPRTHVHTESQKAESLAKPFAKHASYVLVAYVDAFNDPLCIVDAETRRDLEPGLFALCEMVGEHSRDALMVSALDSGGKTILKSLWREYEKQRYVGKG